MNILEKIQDFSLYQEILPELKTGLDVDSWLEKIPILEKRSIIKNFPENIMTLRLKEALLGKKIEYNSTSGTTDERMQIIRKIDWWDEEEQRIGPFTRLWGKYINDPSYSRAVLTTPMCSNSVCYRENPSFEARSKNKKLYLNTAASPDEWTHKDVQQMVNEIDLFRPMHFHADPVYLTVFIHLLTLFKISPPNWIPNFLTLSFEFATMGCVKIIRNFWKIPSFSLYGSTELGYLFCECNKGKMHWCEPLTKLHFIPFQNRKNVFHLAVTSIKNEYMPFIKYSTNDLFLINHHKKNSCDNNCDCDHPSSIYIDKILGRQNDVTVTKENEIITLGELDQILGNLNNPIFLYQLDFSIKNQITFKYLSFALQTLTLAQEKEIYEILYDLYGESNKIAIIPANFIKPELSGKYSLIKKIRI